MAIKYDPILDALREADTSGSSDTASNLGTGVGVFSYKNSGVFYFNSLANSSTIGVSTASGGNIAFNLLSVPSALIPDPLNINNLSVNSSASINRLDVQNTYFSLTGGATPLVEGQLSWDSTYGHLGYGLPGGNVELAIGMQNVLPRRCKNSSGTTMTKGTVVYISSVSGNDPVVSRARANTDATSAFTIGVCAEDIPDGQKGWITTYGVVSGLNLSSYTAGDTVYLSGTTAGEFTKTKPYAPTHYVRIGIVTKATSSGDLYVQVLNGFEMDELHNVSAQSAASGDILRYNSTTNLWEKTGLVTPQSKALISGQFLDSYDATTGLFSSSVFNASNISHNNLSGLQGGTAGEYNHLTNAQVTNLNNQSGTNTGDETKSSIETKLGAATSSNSGYLTSTDWSTFNGKLTPNAPITGATKTKITYDANGLVTAGADATTADISDTTNKRYVTDVDLTKLSNTSGTNTGDVTVTDSSTIDFTLTGQALTGSVIEGGITHNNLGSLQGGTAGEYNHLTNAQLTVVQNTSGTNTGDQIVPQNSAAVTNNFLTAYNNTTGAFTRARPTWANIDKTNSPINDLSDVVISSPVNSEVLTYEASTNSWKNKSNPVPENILENANHINNSTNGYGGISNGWTDASANPIQGGFPYLEWDAVYDPGATTAFWYLNEASGNAIDGKTGTYTLTDTNTVGASATLGLMDYARSFDGVNKRFSGTVALGNVAGSQTFVAFVRPSVVNVAQHICGYNDGTRSAYLGISATGKAFFNFTGTTPTIVTSDVTLQANKWYLIIGSYDSGAGELRIFVNGVYKAVSCTGTHVVTTNNIFQIGATNSANHFNGYINAVAHYYQIGWDEEKMLSLFAVSIYKNTKIYRSDTVSEISLYQLLGREQMHRFNSQTVTFSAEVYQTNASNAKVTIYNGSANYDSNIVTQTGSWWPVTVTFTFASNNAEVYFNLRTSSGAVGPIWYRNIKLNYGNTPIGNNIHNVLDWQKFPRLLMLDIPKMYDGYPYQYEENKWYTWTPTTNPTGATGANTEWKFQGNKCFIKGQITQTHASATWTHTLPIYTGSGEVIRGRWGKVQNNAGTVGLGNWFQTTVNTSSVNMYSSIANGAWSTTSGAKVFIFDMAEWEID